MDQNQTPVDENVETNANQIARECDVLAEGLSQAAAFKSNRNMIIAFIFGGIGVLIIILNCLANEGNMLGENSCHIMTFMAGIFLVILSVLFLAQLDSPARYRDQAGLLRAYHTKIHEILGSPYLTGDQKTHALTAMASIARSNLGVIKNNFPSLQKKIKQEEVEG